MVFRASIWKGVQSTSALQFVLLQKQFYLSVLFLCLKGTQGWSGVSTSLAVVADML